MILTNNSTYPIGLDISDLSIKLVQLNKVRDKITIQALGKLSLPKNTINKGEIINKPELIKAIRKIVSSPAFGKTSSKEVVACLPESKTFIKSIEVQKSPNALIDIIGSEIEKHVPLSKSEIYYDWQVIKETTEKYFILIGAAPKEIVDQYTAMLDEAKLSPVALEIEPTAIARSLLKEEAPNLKPLISGTKNKPEIGINYGLIDIGADHTCMIFYSNNTILFTVSMPISGGEVTAKISKALALTKEQAEKAKIICGMDETKANGVIKEILADTVKNLVEKIKEAIQYYENYFCEHGALNQILLSGGGANITNLVKIIGQELPVEVRLADTLTNLNEDQARFNKFFTEKHVLDIKTPKLDSKCEEKSLSIKQNTSAAYATAIGLALRGIFIDEY
ncbi:MAG: type IV pilus assembly protein PilM [bacterium]|nr:type IV pilus assembly protein PilM [bacterium]